MAEKSNKRSGPIGFLIRNPSGVLMLTGAALVLTPLLLMWAIHWQAALDGGVMLGGWPTEFSSAMKVGLVACVPAGLGIFVILGCMKAVELVRRGRIRSRRSVSRN